MLQYRNGRGLALVTRTLARMKAMTEIANCRNNQLVLHFDSSSVATYLSPCQFQALDAQVPLEFYGYLAIGYLVSVAV